MKMITNLSLKPLDGFILGGQMLSTNVSGTIFLFSNVESFKKMNQFYNILYASYSNKMISFDLIRKLFYLKAI